MSDNDSRPLIDNEINNYEDNAVAPNQDIEMASSRNNPVLSGLEEKGVDMWNHCIKDEFPISEVIQNGNDVILKIGSPHQGFVIESIINRDKLNGKAIMKNDKGVLIGVFVYVNDEANGSCKLYNENGDLYFEGYLKNGYREGYGMEYDIEGNVIFEGNFVKGMRKNGLCYLYKDNKMYEVCKYDNDEIVCMLIRFEGNEMMEYNEKGHMIYQGGFIESKKYRYFRNGFGRLYNTKGKVIYEGEWKDGRKQGKGTLISNGHRLFSGKWILNCPLSVLILFFIILILLIILVFILVVGLARHPLIGHCLGYSSNNILIIDSKSCNETYISFFYPKLSLEYIDIGDECFVNVNKFMVNGLNHLNSLRIGSSSFTTGRSECINNPFRSFHLLNCAKLESIEIGEYSFCDYGGGFELINLPKLSTIKIGEMGSSWSWNFYYSSFVIKGIIDMILLMNRSSTFEFH